MGNVRWSKLLGRYSSEKSNSNMKVMIFINTICRILLFLSFYFEGVSDLGKSGVQCLNRSIRYGDLHLIKELPLRHPTEYFIAFTCL